MTEHFNSNRTTIRPAQSDDFEWVSHSMEKALSPFYGGNHRAHARRIFDTHMSGGIDYVGHFSAGQHMYIAEIEGTRVGLIHIVEKKQATVKVSPLIVSPEYRGTHGVGSSLLDHAEHIAIDLGARQMYCTVASPNISALNFFQRKGYRITGTAKDHYLIGVDEHMLYKQLIDDSGMNSPIISVIPFNPEVHADGVRQLVLAKLPQNFLGVDDSWVDALFAGYDRRIDADINTKYKIIFVAESGGNVMGVAGATPKKGNPIKLMPLVAANEAAFEALIIDLQGLLVDYGHKLYVHLVPESWQVSCLQRHGWSLEGVFPGGYAPHSVVQQWGLSLMKEGLNVRTMRIKRPYFDAIMRGAKPLEVRVGYNSIKRYQVGEHVRLETSQVNAMIQIKAIRTYPSFKSMLEVENWKHIVPDAPNKERALRLLEEIYPPDKEALGVYVFQIEPVK